MEERMASSEERIRVEEQINSREERIRYRNIRLLAGRTA